MRMNYPIQTLLSPARRWRPAPLILASMVFHFALLGAWGTSAISGLFLLCALAANHLCIALFGMWPRSRMLGDNRVRLPDRSAARGEVSLTFDDGPDPNVTPKVLDLLDEYQAKASFFCVGEKVRAHPTIVAEILRRGHSVENHSQRHSNFFACLGLKTLLRDIEATQQEIGAASGRRPLFFRAPMGLRSPLLDPVLHRLGLTYVSWTRRGFDTVSRDAGAVVRRLNHGLAAGDILVLHDTRHAPNDDPLVLLALPQVLKQICDTGLRSVSLPMALQ